MLYCPGPGRKTSFVSFGRILILIYTQLYEYEILETLSFGVYIPGPGDTMNLFGSEYAEFFDAMENLGPFPTLEAELYEPGPGLEFNCDLSLGSVPILYY